MTGQCRLCGALLDGSSILAMTRRLAAHMKLAHPLDDPNPHARQEGQR